MRQLASARHLCRATAASTLLAAVALSSCGPNSQELWECNDPGTTYRSPLGYSWRWRGGGRGG